MAKYIIVQRTGRILDVAGFHNLESARSMLNTIKNEHPHNHVWLVGLAGDYSYIGVHRITKHFVIRAFVTNEAAQAYSKFYKIFKV